MSAAIESIAGPDQNVGRYSQPPDKTVRALGAPVLRLARVWDNDHQVVIAITSGIAPGLRSEEVDSVGMKCLHETANDFQYGRIIRRSPGRVGGIVESIVSYQLPTL